LTPIDGQSEYAEQKDIILAMVNNCRAISWSMGNTKTNNLYCGKDPDYNQVHDENYRDLHFYGCGQTQEVCSERPCCSDANRYELNSTNCDNKNETRLLYSPKVLTNENITIGCIDHFTECFMGNYIYYG